MWLTRARRSIRFWEIQGRRRRRRACLAKKLCLGVEISSERGERKKNGRDVFAFRGRLAIDFLDVGTLENWTSERGTAAVQRRLGFTVVSHERLAVLEFASSRWRSRIVVGSGKQNGRRTFGHGSLAPYSIPKALYFLHERLEQSIVFLFVTLFRAELGAYCPSIVFYYRPTSLVGQMSIAHNAARFDRRCPSRILDLFDIELLCFPILYVSLVATLAAHLKDHI